MIVVVLPAATAVPVPAITATEKSVLSDSAVAAIVAFISLLLFATLKDTSA